MKIIISINNKLKKYQIGPGKRYKIGQASDCDITVSYETVSRSHLLIWEESGKLFVEDIGSTNGTFVNGYKLREGEAQEIAKDQKVYISNKNVFLQIHSKAAEKNEQNGTGLKGQKGGEKKGRSLSDYLKKKQEIFIGRSSTCDIVLNDIAVSRKHARVFKVKEKVFVEDLNSKNGIYINGKKVSKTELKRSDTLFIMLHAFSLQKVASDYSEEAAISTKSISKIYSNGYQGLQDTTLQIPYKKMVALMGPSGCGKSTLMKALNGDNPPTSGKVKIFGLDMADHFEMLKHVIGYVPQENIVHEDLTVNDSLYYAAKLRLPEDTSDDFIKNRIDEVLEALKINDKKLRKNKVSELSGGQKKRISIAVEILSKPKILFLDEPTSPLDPETIEEFLNCVKNLCSEGTTVVMVTHKPEDLNYVDRVIFMGVKGHMVFDGDKDELLSYFNVQHIIPLYSMLSILNNTKHWYEKWKSSTNTEPGPTKEIKVSQLQVNRFHQVFWLSRRYFSVKTGNLKNLAIMLLQPVLIALLVVLAFDILIAVEVINIPQPDGTELEERKTIPNLGLLFLMAVAAVWFGVSNSAKEIVGEKDILKRESMINMRLSSYIFSKLLILSIISAVQLLILLALLFLNYDDLSSFGYTFEFLMLVSLCSITFGLLLSSVTSTSEEVMSILPIALMPQIILAGMIQPIENTLTMYLSYFTLGRWGTEGLARIQDLEQDEEPFMEVLEGRLYNEDLFDVPVDELMLNSLNYNIYFLIFLFFIMITAVYFLTQGKIKSAK